MKQLSEERACMVERSWMEAFDSPEFWNPKVRGAECLNRQAARFDIADRRSADEDGDGRLL